MYKPINRRAVITALQGQNLPEIALAVPCSNDDRPLTMLTAAQIMEPIRSICDDYRPGKTAEQIKLREQCDFVDTLTTGTEKDMHFKNTVNYIYCGNSKLAGNPIGPDRRRTAQRGTRVAFERPATW
jgi:hypothetical protein